MKKSWHFSNYPALSSLFVFLVIFSINVYLQPRVLTYRVLYSNLSTFTPLVLVAMSQAVVILSGNIDLSTGAMLSLLNVVMATLFQNTLGSVLAGIIIAFAIALLGGMVNGYFVGYLRLPPIVTTFATAFVWSGIALLIMPQPGGHVPKWLYRLFQSGRLQFPLPLFLIVVALLIWWLTVRKPLGRKIYAVGGNRISSVLSGIDHRQVILMTYMLSSFFLALAAVALTGLVASGDARVGTPVTLTSIAAVAIGGNSLRGGRGGVIGPMLGAILLFFISNIILLVGVPSLYQDFIKGTIIVGAIGLAVLTQYRR
ncbi:MAG: ABC transporter permease [Atribacterota bacterium]